MDTLAPVLSSRHRFHGVQNGTNGDAAVSGALGGTGEHSLAGHPCAAGCGHFCWMAIGEGKPPADVQNPMRG